MIIFSTGHQKETKYLVDFDPTLREIVTETKYMETLGFSVPELARNVALQVWTQFAFCC
jgi:dynein heavy chain